MTETRWIKSDVTLLRIIEALKDLEGAGITEISATTGVSKSTIHAHLKTLQREGYVVRNGDEYHLGLEFLALGNFTQKQQEVYPHAKPIVDQLTETTGQKALCITEENGKAVFLYEAIGEYPVQSQVDPGEKTGLHCLAGGKAILAHLPQERRDAVIANSSLEQYTKNTICDPAELERECEKIKDRGVAYNFEESTLGLHAIGAPIRGKNDAVLGAISVSGPANRLSEEMMKNELCETLLGSANEIEINMQHL